jgi:hypothetical protein
MSENFIQPDGPRKNITSPSLRTHYLGPLQSYRVVLHATAWSWLYMSNGPCRLGHGWARHEGHQSKPDTVQYRAGLGWLAGWLTWPRPGTVILTRAVPERAWTRKQKNALKFRI